MNYRTSKTPGMLKAFAAGCVGALILIFHCYAQNLSPLASAPDWSALEKFQETITREEFEQLLQNVYAPNDAWKPFIAISADSASILTSGSDIFTLRFATSREDEKTPSLYWKPARKLKPAPVKLPLRGLKIALDPGHLGGRWAKIEERWFQIGENTKSVTEGDMTLRVARLLAPKLRALGADVTLVRRKTEPVTNLRPEDLRDAAKAELQRQGIPLTPPSPDSADNNPEAPPRPDPIELQSELLFYRTAEIHKRAQIVNREIKPDLVLCLHFNAEDWGDPKSPRFVDRNHLHLLVNGCYSQTELALEDVRFEMLMKLLMRCYDEELPAAETVANYVAWETGLVPYEYTRPNARRVGDNPYIWARNLLANRLYHCPVVYLEPYVMNSQPVWERVQIGDYKGLREVGGEMRKSIYREYADAVADGLVAYYRETRKKNAEAQRTLRAAEKK